MTIDVTIAIAYQPDDYHPGTRALIQYKDVVLPV